MTCGSIFDAARLREQLGELEKKIADPNFWSNPELSQPLALAHRLLGEFRIGLQQLEQPIASAIVQHGPE